MRSFEIIGGVEGGSSWEIFRQNRSFVKIRSDVTSVSCIIVTEVGRALGFDRWISFDGNRGGVLAFGECHRSFPCDLFRLLW